MKLTTFSVGAPVGPVERFGLVKLDGGVGDTVSSARAGSGWVIDANAAYAGFLAHRGKPNAAARARTGFVRQISTDVWRYTALRSIGC